MKTLCFFFPAFVSLSLPAQTSHGLGPANGQVRKKKGNSFFFLEKGGRKKKNKERNAAKKKKMASKTPWTSKRYPVNTRGHK